MPVSQWLSARPGLSDWTTSRRTEAGNRASLQNQPYGPVAHPLTMGVALRQVTGFQRPTLPPGSRLSREDVTDPDLWDLLATEDLAPLCDQNGNPLGIA